MYLVTGSTGFVGRAVVLELRARGLSVREVSRVLQSTKTEDVCYVPAIDGDTDWQEALQGVEVVIHCAARAHRMNDPEDSFDQYQSVNTDGTLCLANACVAADVRRFIFVSTIKVCADSTLPGQPVFPDAPLTPTDWYSQTKADAEVALKKLADSTALEMVIVRPPLVYGPGAKGNLERLVKIVSMGVPLPLGAINNRRSLVGLANLADFLILASHHAKADGQVFNISDGTTVSTTDILKALSKALNKKTILIPIPASLLAMAGKVTGKSAYVDRLTSNLEVDSSNCFELLDWKPPLSVSESIASLVS